MLKICFVFTSLGCTRPCSPWLNTVYFQLLPSPSFPAVWIAVPQREMHGGILARTPKFLSPPSRWQLWVLAWKNNTERLEPAVLTSAAESWGAEQGAALPCGWKVPVELVTPMAPLWAAHSASLLALVWRVPQLRKLCQFVSHTAGPTQWLTANYFFEGIRGGS